MHIVFLGTSGGEGYPGMWCKCEYCEYARTHGGRNHRENSSALLDEDVLLDLNMTTFSQAYHMGADLSGVNKVLVTHPHEDHFVPMYVDWMRLRGDPNVLEKDYAQREPAPCCTNPEVLRVMGTAHTLQAISNGKASDSIQDAPGVDWRSERTRVDFTLARPGTTACLGDDLLVTPLRAIHGGAPDYTANYIIQRGGKTLLYALDTGGYDEDMWDVVRRFVFDAVVLEGSAGLSLVHNPQHMNLQKLRAFFAKLEAEGLLMPGAPKVLSHMAPHWTPPYDMYAPMMAKEGIIVAYDGMTLDF